MKRLEILLLATLGGFAAASLLLTRDYNSTAALFPRIIAVVCLLFLVLIGIEGRRRISEPSIDTSEIHLRPSIPSILALQAAYIVLIYVVGFLAATFLYLVVAPIQLRYRRRGVALVTSVVLTLGLGASFLWLFSIQPPAGAIWELW